MYLKLKFTLTNPNWTMVLIKSERILRPEHNYNSKFCLLCNLKGLLLYNI